MNRQEAVRIMLGAAVAFGVSCLHSHAADPKVKASSSAIQLTDVTKESGVTFVHSSGASGLGYIVEAMSGGLVTFDYDNDGLCDIFFTNGTPLKGSKLPSGSLKPSLYRNLGNWKFADVTEEAGITSKGYGLGAVAADYDNDGDQDLFITHFGFSVLYRNNGDKTFTTTSTHFLN